MAAVSKELYRKLTEDEKEKIKKDINIIIEDAYSLTPTQIKAGYLPVTIENIFTDSYYIITTEGIVYVKLLGVDRKSSVEGISLNDIVPGLRLAKDGKDNWYVGEEEQIFVSLDEAMAKKREMSRAYAKVEYAKYNAKIWGRGGRRTRNKRKTKKRNRTFKKVRK